jgi:nanoRNase/pAp phosphatase (c-di-AMP/oligoRNAs hydrolase)
MSADKDCKFAAIFYWDGDKDAFKVSLRGKGKVDVSKVAEEYGGGGTD